MNLKMNLKFSPAKNVYDIMRKRDCELRYSNIPENQNTLMGINRVYLS